jgi:hypothetical protein
MATVAQTFVGDGRREDRLSGTARAHALDRWIYVVTAVLFIVVTLVGFIPDSLGKIAAVKAGQRAPFPMVLHLHAALMGSFLLLLLAQTWLVATGRCDRHMLLGRLGMVLAPALVVVGLVLVPTTYHGVWSAAQAALPAARGELGQLLLTLENIMLMQLRIGFLFPLLLGIGLAARGRNAGLHKRMMILAPAMALPAAIDRMAWLPTTLPASPLATDLYTLLLLSPLFLWDVARNRSVHPAWLVWGALALPLTLAVHVAWDKPWWHAAARGIMGV